MENALNHINHPSFSLSAKTLYIPFNVKEVTGVAAAFVGAFRDGGQLFVLTVLISDGNFLNKCGGVNYMKINKDYNASARGVRRRRWMQEMRKERMRFIHSLS